MSLIKLHLSYNIFVDSSVKATIQVFHVLGIFDGVDNADEHFKDYITFKKRQSGTLKTETVDNK